MIVCSSGGHLLQMQELRAAWSDFERIWVTFDKSDARSLLRGERVVHAFSPTNRNIPNLLRNLRLAWRTLRRERPAAILTTGAGVAVPYAWVGRLLGIPTFYVESVTRIEGLSLSARLIAPVATRMYAQWPELAEASGGRDSIRGQPLRRPMIVVTVGTHEQPFDRLVEAAAELAGDEPLVVQYGTSRRTHGAGEWHDYLSFDELAEYARDARVFVCHAGVGSIVLARRFGHRPVVVPRRHHLGEHVDDHQLSLARRLGRAGVVTRARGYGRARARSSRHAWHPGPFPRRAICCRAPTRSASRSTRRWPSSARRATPSRSLGAPARSGGAVARRERGPKGLDVAPARVWAAQLRDRSRALSERDTDRLHARARGAHVLARIEHPAPSGDVLCLAGVGRCAARVPDRASGT